MSTILLNSNANHNTTIPFGYPESNTMALLPTNALIVGSLPVHSSFESALNIVEKSISYKINEERCYEIALSLQSMPIEQENRDNDYALCAFMRFLDASAARMNTKLNLERPKTKQRIDQFLKASFDVMSVSYVFTPNSLSSLINTFPWCFNKPPFYVEALRALQDFSHWSAQKGVGSNYQLHPAVLPEEVDIIEQMGVIIPSCENTASNISNNYDIEKHASAIVAAHIIVNNSGHEDILMYHRLLKALQ